MIKKYNNFILEGYENKPDTLYHKNNYFAESINNNWTNIVIKKVNSKIKDNLYKIIFKAVDNKDFSYHSVILESGSSNDIFYLNDNIVNEFIEKFKLEFMKNENDIDLKNIKYVPKCIGKSLNDLKMQQAYDV